MISRKKRDAIVFTYSIALVVLALLLMLSSTGCAVAADEPLRGITIQPEIRAEVLAARDRIEKATGIRLEETEHGVPVTLDAEIWRGGEQLCGGTDYDRGNGNPLRIRISAQRTGMMMNGEPVGHCLDRSVDEVHELLHLILGMGDIHSQTGVLKSGASDDTINAEVLETVCSHVACQAFNPEAP